MGACPASRPPFHSEGASPSLTDGRALELLAASRDGCTEAILFAHGLSVIQMVDLVREGLATAHSRRVIVGKRVIEPPT
jgi:hypothetical protein